MSLVGSRDALIHDKQQELARTLLSRKRKLCELYALTTTPLPARQTPKTIDHLLDSRFNPALSTFLDQNDIEHGRLFDPSTIPARTSHDFSVHSQRVQHERDSTGLKPALDSPSTTLKSSTTDYPRDHVHFDARDSVGRHDDAANSRVVDAETSFRESTPVSDPQSAAQPIIVRKESSRQPQSPPYSPATEAQQPDGQLPQPSSSLPRPALTPNGLSPTVDLPNQGPNGRKRGRDQADDQDADSGRHEPVARLDSAAREVPERVNAEERENAALMKSQDDHGNADGTADNAGEPASSPTSSTAPAHSTDASRAGGQTPLTSVGDENDARRASEDDRNRENGLEVHHKVRNQHSETPAKDHGVKVDKKTTPFQQDGSGIDRPNIEDGTKADRRPALQPATTSCQNQTSLPSPSSRKSHRVEKRKRSSSATTLALLKNPFQARSEAIAKHFYQNSGVTDGRLQGPKKDYMHLLFLQQALDQNTGAKLGDVLSNSNKSLTTNDWEMYIHEKLDTSIVKRIYEWQQKNRWSLRLMRPYPEPKMPGTHQDHLMSELKWLQTDFREERKLKTAVAYQLARDCREWVQASAEDRTALQVQVKPQKGLQQMSLRGDLGEDERQVDARPRKQSVFTQNLHSDIVSQLPLYSAPGFKDEHLHTAGTTVAPTDQRTDPQGDNSEELASRSGRESRPRTASEDKPDDDFCALFDSEWKPLRARVNANSAFRPPAGPIPSQGFYEHRRASQWLWEDEQQLRGFVRDFPSNWALIADRMAPRTSFVSSTDRRTPWECYERLLGLEGQPQDVNGRQYVKHFAWQLDKSRAKWNNAQTAFQHQLQQQAQISGQNSAQIPTPQRFPTPQRVERKTSRRFLALLDGARKLSKKRENMANRAAPQNIQDATNQAQRNNAREVSKRTPQEMSALKFRRIKEDAQRMEDIKARQRAALQSRVAQQGGSLPNNANVQMYNGNVVRQVPGGGNNATMSVTANGHLAVPQNGQARPSSHQQQQALAMGMANGMSANNQMAQMMANNRSVQALASQQQRLGSQFSGGNQMSEQNMQRLLQAQQAQQQQSNQHPQQQQNPQGFNQYPGHRSVGSGQFSNGSPTTNGIMDQFGNQQGSMQSPALAQATRASNSQASPVMGQSATASNSGQFANQSNQSRLQSLSSGHTPAIERMRHEIQTRNPHLTTEEVNQQVNQRARELVGQQYNQQYSQSRQNALNAASGNVQVQGQQQAQHQHSNSGSQSPYVQQQQQQQSQQAGTPQQQAAFQSNALLASNHLQGRSASPTNPMTQQSQQQYHQQLRLHMQANRMMSPNGGGGLTSPAMGGMTMPANYRTPTPSQHTGMRPPSQNAGNANGMNGGMGMNVGTQGGEGQQRPGSSSQQQMNQMATPKLASQSPRPLSSQGAG